MALTNYTDLQASIANWLGGRSDLNGVIPDFVTLFEKAANRRLRVLGMLTSSDLTTVSGVATLPSDFLVARAVTWLGNPSRGLEYALPAWLTLNYISGQTGTPTYYSLTKANTITVVPFDDTSQTRLIYYQQIPPLGNVGTNWLMTAHPDAYLFGSLAESGGYVQDDNALQKWIARRDALFEEIELLDKRSAGVGGMKVAGPTP